MKQYLKNCKRFETYKKFRTITGTTAGSIMIISAFIFGYNQNLLALFILLLTGGILAILSKTATGEKFYTDDGIEIKRII